MPKSRHRKDQKSRSRNRTARLKEQHEKYQKEMMEERKKLLEDAKQQQEANLKKEVK